MDGKTLREVQLVQLEIAKEIKRVCEKNNITYFLDSGTLLGAVRHKGFIPWDDDLDIGFLRDEYERFLKACEVDLKDDYFLQTWYTDPNYGLPFGKIRKKNTTFVENTSKNCKAMNGVYVDIFPYDDYFPEKNKFINMKVTRYILYRIILLKNGYRLAQDMNVVKYFLMSLPLKILGMPFSNDFLKKSFDKMVQREKDDCCKLCYPQGISNYGHWVMKKSFFEEVEMLEFENDMFCCPKEWDTYLKLVYDDYMQLPPEDQRENRHRVLEIKL